MFRLWWMIFWRLWVVQILTSLFLPFAWYGEAGLFIITTVLTLVMYKGFKITLLPQPFRRLLSGAQWWSRVPPEYHLNGYTQQSGFVASSYPPQEQYQNPQERFQPHQSQAEYQYRGYGPSQGFSSPSNVYSQEEEAGFNKVPPFTIPRPISEVAERKGRMTGYESNKLEHLTIPDLPTVHGVPGIGLNYGNNFDEQASFLGRVGEENFAKALSITDLNGNKNLHIPYSDSMLGRYYSFWSLGLPQFAGRMDYGTDVDCVLVYGRKMMLIDLKFYKGGDVTYYGDGSHLFTVDNETTDWVGPPKKMSHNMELALERFQQAFPMYDIEAMIILMPTNMGMGVLSSFPYTPVYPGGVGLESVDYSLKYIRNFFSDQRDRESMNAVCFPQLESLLRGGC